MLDVAEEDDSLRAEKVPVPVPVFPLLKSL